ncbi:MAG: extracellular solute-binding protein, partial [Ktedonobacteraceae bacterium]|nr:extracellular solute-binding protein [Ktedonobacteraceae bacterium]
MSKGMQRRAFLQMSAAGLLTGAFALGLEGCGDSSATTVGNGKSLLQLTYWGSTARIKRTNKVIELFEQKYPGVKISSQYSDFGSYWPKLATQISGNSEPDLIQTDVAYISQYVGKGLLLNLSKYIPSKINLSDFNQVMLKGSEKNGNVYGVPMGGNFLAIYYDQDMLEKAGVPLPPQHPNWTWDGFADYALKISKALGPNVYGTEDASANMQGLETLVRQRGKELYTPDGKLGYTEQDALDWFNYWDRMRKTGACAPADV